MENQPIKNYVLEGALCPVCGKEDLTASETIYSVPHYGKTLLVLVICKRCGFKNTEVYPLEYHEPAHHEIRVENQQDLQARIIRSDTATIRIPELGVILSPGMSAESFISNIEGVLERIKEKAEILDNKGRSKAFFRSLASAENGKLAFTFILEDPSGNSAILSNNPGRVKSRKLSDKELITLTR